MAELFYPFDAGAGSAITEGQWRKMASLWRDSGVIWETGGSGNLRLQVYADSSGMQVKVRTGLAFIKGHYYENDAEKILAIGANATGANRIDRVILRADFTANTIAAVILPGTAAPAALTQTLTMWEIELAQVTVPNGAVTIAAGNVADGRRFTMGSEQFLEAVWTGVALPTTDLFEGRRIWATGLTNTLFRDKHYVYRGGKWRLDSAMILSAIDTGAGPRVLTAGVNSPVLAAVNLGAPPCDVVMYVSLIVNAYTNSVAGSITARLFQNTIMIIETAIAAVAGYSVSPTIVSEGLAGVAGTAQNFETKTYSDQAYSVYNSATFRTRMKLEVI